MDALLDDRLGALASAGAFPTDLVVAFGRFLTEAPDEDLFRTNPIRFAASTGTPEPLAVELFVYAARHGLLDLAWGVLCPRCGSFMGTRTRLRSLGDHSRCGLCRVSVLPSADDNVEVAFTVNPAVRALRLHRPLDELHPDDAALGFFSTSISRAPGFAAAMARDMVAHAMIAPQATAVLEADVDPDLVYALGCPGHHAGAELVVVDGGPTEIRFDVLQGALVPGLAEIGSGRVRLVVRNPTSRVAGVGLRALPRAVALALERGEIGPPVDPLPILSVKRLLSSQAFRDLFRVDSLPSEEGLELRNLAVLFTDLKGSTALYERVGDLRAYNVVRGHFAVLRDRVRSSGGAVVKTMGDAIMATFADPLAAMEAAAAMHEDVRRLAPEEVLLKIGVHAGGCIAVENDERLDYFGQTVNIAARVQALADAREIVCTEAVFAAPGVADVVARAGYAPRREHARLKGVGGTTEVVRLQGA